MTLKKQELVTTSESSYTAKEHNLQSERLLLYE